MGWDSAAPTQEELGSASDWTSSPPTREELDSVDKSVAGFGRNAWEDVKGTAKGIGGLLEGLSEHPVDTATNVVKGLPGAVVNEGKRLGVGELLTGHPINAAGKFVDAAYEKPLSTTLDVLPAAGAVGKALGLGGEAAKGADLAAQAAKAVPEAAGTAATEEAAGVIPFGRAVGNTVTDVGAEAAENAPKITPKLVPEESADMVQELRDYLGSKYGAGKDLANKGYAAAAKKPGWSNTLADYLDRYAQNMSVKNLGGSPRQVGELGPEASRAVGQYALDKGFTAPNVGEIGMEKKISDLIENAGSKVGSYRKLATERGGPIAKDDLLNAIKTQLDPVYTKGIESGQKGTYMKALQELERADMTHEGLSKLATKLNKSATDAKRLKQASGAMSDVANAVTRFNNAKIAEVLNPQELADYKNALNEFGMGKKMEQFNAFKERREVGGRLGPGGGVRHLAQKFLDEVGYKAGARIASNMSKMIRSNPSLAKSLPSLFGQFVDQVHDLLPEDFTSGNMAHGGIVGNDELDEYLSTKYGIKKETR